MDSENLRISLSKYFFLGHLQESKLPSKKIFFLELLGFESPRKCLICL
jgi:hypothetical protein